MHESVDVALENVSKWYGEICAVNDLSLSINKGDFFALLGPSGCGKSTTLRMIAGLEETSSGRVYIQKEDVTDIPSYRRPTNMVFQNLALFPHLNVFENLAFGLRLKGLTKGKIKKKITNVLDLIQLPGMETRRINELSGGQQQRVALARAIVNEPSVLLLDEALGSLDQKLRKSMQLEMKTLQQKLGITFIYVTHDQNEALTMADQIGVMDQGRLVQVGSGYDLYMYPQSKFVADFIGETNLVRVKIVQIEEKEVLVEGSGMKIRVAIPSYQQGNIAAEKKVFLSLRPENILFEPDAESAPNHFRSVIRKIIFLGSNIQVTIASEGLELMAHVPEKIGLSFQEGQAITFGWESDACSLVMQ